MPAQPIREQIAEIGRAVGHEAYERGLSAADANDLGQIVLDRILALVGEPVEGWVFPGWADASTIEVTVGHGYDGQVPVEVCIRPLGGVDDA